MKILYLDCFAGVSGDMFVGALLDLGVPLTVVEEAVAQLRLPGIRLEATRVTRNHMAATQFCCHAAEDQSHRSYSAIAELIHHSDLSAVTKARALNVLRRLGEAEAKIHGVTLEQVHFHEIGAVDSIVDIIGSCAALEALQVDAVESSPPPLGIGTTQTAHGLFPLPAPATLELLKGVPVCSAEQTEELVTPTGAALLAEFCRRFGSLPAMRLERVGYGAGSRDTPHIPNVLRAILGEAAPAHQSVDTVAVLETNLDDCNPQLLGDVMEQLLAAGALDVFFTPVQMKKNRPATLLTVLCAPADADRLAELTLVQTTSFGVRMHEARRSILERELRTVATAYGDIVVKIGRRSNKVLSCSPEYESCRQAAARHHVPVKQVYLAAQCAAKELGHD